MAKSIPLLYQLLRGGMVFLLEIPFQQGITCIYAHKIEGYQEGLKFLVIFYYSYPMPFVHISHVSCFTLSQSICMYSHSQEQQL